MAIAVWPSDVPFRPMQAGWSEQPERNVVSFKPEVGPPKERRRGTASGSIVKGTIMVSSAEVDAFWAFYRGTLLDGVLPFTLVHPRTLQPGTWKFEGEAPVESPYGGLNWQLSFQLRRMP
jgi:hypothetical protein